jgi:hypothetical protein
VQVKKEVSPTTSEPPQSLNLQRLNTRVRNQIEEKKRMVKALQAGVSPEGQKLFIAISKTINEITWNGPNIVVWDKVTIIPPYKIENVQGNSDDKAFTHIKKVVRSSLPSLLSTTFLFLFYASPFPHLIFNRVFIPTINFKTNYPFVSSFF